MGKDPLHMFNNISVDKIKDNSDYVYKGRVSIERTGKLQISFPD